MKLGDAVEAGDAALRQNAGLTQFRFPEEDGDFASVDALRVWWPSKRRFTLNLPSIKVRPEIHGARIETPLYQ